MSGTILVVEPAASGGLAAHVRDELDALRADAFEAVRADVDIRPRPDPLRDLATVRALRRRARRGDVLAVHAHGLRAGALAALALPRRGSAPRLVVTLHNRTVGSRAQRALGGALLRILCRRADTVLAVSGDLADAARGAGARDVRIAVIPAHRPAVTGDPHPEDLAAGAPSDGGLAVLVIARLAPQKGLDTLLDAAARWARAAPGRIRVRVVGDGPEEAHLAARIHDEALDVELLGRREDVPALLATADVVVSSAVWEGQPVSLQEALHAGLPVVATDAGGTREVTGSAAVLVPVGDDAALAEAVLALLDVEELARRADASRLRALDLPGIEDMATQLRAVLAPGPRR